MQFMATINIKDFMIGFSDQFFFDTNVWLLLFGSVADFEKKDQKAYSKLLEDLIVKDKPIFISSNILSEYANVLLRKEFKKWVKDERKVGVDFKSDFVGVLRYNQTVELITISINKILKLPNIQPVSDSFHCINTENILNNFKIVDFNDAYIGELALQNKYKVVTNDKDFQKLNSGIEIITARI
jgi:predicted nucleic acid-binding protein